MRFIIISQHLSILFEIFWILDICQILISGTCRDNWNYWQILRLYLSRWYKTVKTYQYMQACTDFSIWYWFLEDQHKSQYRSIFLDCQNKLFWKCLTVETDFTTLSRDPHAYIFYMFEKKDTFLKLSTLIKAQQGGFKFELKLQWKPLNVITVNNISRWKRSDFIGPVW